LTNDRQDLIERTTLPLPAFLHHVAPQRRVGFIIQKTKFSFDQENINVSRETFFP
jgi:hypothetical protein